MVMAYKPLSELSKEVRIVDGKVIIGTMEVDIDGRYPLTENQVPTLYVVRVLGDGWWRFVSGFDLVKEGFWVGGGYDIGDSYGKRETVASFANVENIFNNICTETKGKEWAIFTEDCYSTQEEEDEMNQQQDDLYDDPYDGWGDYERWSEANEG